MAPLCMGTVPSPCSFTAPATQLQGAMQLRTLVTVPAAPALQRRTLRPTPARRQQRAQAFFGKLFGGSASDQDVSWPGAPEAKATPAAAAADGASGRFQTLLSAIPALVAAAGGPGLPHLRSSAAAVMHGTADGARPALAEAG